MNHIAELVKKLGKGDCGDGKRGRSWSEAGGWIGHLCSEEMTTQNVFSECRFNTQGGVKKMQTETSQKWDAKKIPKGTDDDDSLEGK